jgi:7,8-dihydroneopterin aldolase/epimerase/oxygenase
LRIELNGLELFGYHGVEERERRDGQRFLLDLWLEPTEPPAADRIDAAIDYREVAACAREISDASRFQLLETLAAAVADAILERFPVEHVRVRVRKPDVQLDSPVEYSAVTVGRTASSERDEGVHRSGG